MWRAPEIKFSGYCRANPVESNKSYERNGASESHPKEKGLTAAKEPFID
jgi:hypothetical protein